MCRVRVTWAEVWCGLWQRRGETTRGVGVVEIMVAVKFLDNSSTKETRVLMRRASGLSFLLASLLCASGLQLPFFDTNNRLQRSNAPPSHIKRAYVPLYDGKLCVQPVSGLADEHAVRDCAPVLLSEDEATQWISDETAIVIWLGSAEEGPLHAAADTQDGQTPGFFALDLSHLPEPPVLGQHGRWAPLRATRGPGGGEEAVIGGRGVRLRSDDEVALLACARGMASWHHSVRFCAACGGKTEPCRHGRNRRCVDCGTRYRPRLDPSVIVLVTRGDKCLLGRKREWPAGRYSTLAGFVEFGETLEECVLREMEEEAGVRCRRETIRFVGSQPWLFPRSLMVGYIIEAEDGELDVDEAELEDARWFEKAYVREQLALQGDSDAPLEPGGFHVPSSISLARNILEAWLGEDGIQRSS